MSKLNEIDPPPGVPGKGLAQLEEPEEELAPVVEITEEMIDKLESKSNKFMLQACTLDGAGHSKSEIAHSLGISGSTVARFRRDPDYIAMRKALMTRSAQQLEPIVHSLKIALGTAASDAIKTLQEAMSADTLDGSPKWPTRIDAAKILLEHATKLGINAGGGDGGGESGSSSDEGGSKMPSAMVINVNPQVVEQAKATAKHVPNVVDAEEVPGG